MWLCGISVVCERKECPLCHGRGFVAVSKARETRISATVRCAHILPNTAEFTDQMGWALLLAPKPPRPH
ncbi:MAG TPA: hypothetical protein DFS52_19175 [Myxococcales bacterium]|jgi:hypothetical protein|nr:hypothetical protein [Myxococcales bacterium]